MACLRVTQSLIPLLLLTLSPALAQQPNHLSNPVLGNPPTPMEMEVRQRLELEQQKKRYEDMRRDSQRLLELSTELQQYVEKSGPHILSLEVMRKAEELEKLAKRVRETMRKE